MNKDNIKNSQGLSNGNLKLITTIIVIALLLFGPMEPYGILFRTFYLIAIPILLWFLLKYIFKAFTIDNDLLYRIVLASVGTLLLVGAYFSFTSEYHTECTQLVNTGDGRECVGDYISVDGPDKEEGVAAIIFAFLAYSLSLSKHKDEDSN